MKPWIDRDLLLSKAKAFARAHGAFLRKKGERISSLVEIAFYNSVVNYYKSNGFEMAGENLGPKKSFRYKLTANGLTQNYSYFRARKRKVDLRILTNTKIQSAYHDHIYYTPDVVITRATTTQELRSGRRHSFVAKEDLVSFGEVKHLNPFPEALFSFNGLILEFMPFIISQRCNVVPVGDSLCPMIAFTGPASDHCLRIKEELERRYGVNIVVGTYASCGGLHTGEPLKAYERKDRPALVKRLGRKMCLDDEPQMAPERSVTGK